eukprot:comp20186_c0_seq2/m.25044 comp20186_c0_seq2/g.25044  ORF comp20186_c0_seq2/g.25044 comp20186_c0_seq2/m.25044 type:complete len:576 (-) comp20186_c0_seq2:16-1743(-)
MSAATTILQQAGSANPDSVPKPASRPEHKWWDGSVVYQIYPRSFMDSNGDGIGDLEGITKKLDYVQSLGVDAVWISPFFKSPQADFGYDVADYRKVDPMFGTNDDFKRLLDEAHKRGIKVLVDMVLCHSSDQHAWFAESRKDRTNAKADWYVWADPKPDGTEPNNWLSHFGGRAWTWEQRRGQYYLHHFLKEQPNLNYYNPEVVEAVLDECKYWLDEGVDGFRLDAIITLAHDKWLRDNPARAMNDPTRKTLGGQMPFGMQLNEVSQLCQPLVFDFLHKLRALTDKYEDRMMVGEIGGEDGMSISARFVAGDNLLHTSYNFDILGVFDLESGRVQEVVRRSLRLMPPEKISFATSNHDVMRALTRWSTPKPGEEPLGPEAMSRLAQMAIVLPGCLHGQAFLYQGEELGLLEADVPFEALQDPFGKAFWPEFKGRDGCRTPMPWDPTQPNAGFSDGKSWLPVPAEHYPCSVSEQEKDPHSVLNRARKWLNWRKNESAFRIGTVRLIDEVPDYVLGVERKAGAQRYQCFFNLSKEAVQVTLEKGCDFKVSPECGFEGRVSDGTVTMPGLSAVVLSVL